MFQSKAVGVLVLTAVVIIAGALLFLTNSEPELEMKADLAGVVEQTQGTLEIQELVSTSSDIVEAALLIVDNSTGTPQVFEFEVDDEITVFNLLERSRLDFSAKYYDAGAFIESIGELKGGDNNKYWLYYVNGEMPMLAVDQLIVAPGDVIEFKFEESTF